MSRKSIPDCVSFSEEKMKKVNLFESPRFFCDLYCLRPGQEQKVHSHADNDKSYAVQRGSGVVIVGDVRHSVSEGDVGLARSEEPHGVINESDEDLVCLGFMAPHPSFEGAGS